MQLFNTHSEQNANADEHSSESHKQQTFFSELIKLAILVLVVVLPIRLFIAKPFIVNGSSMDPTFIDKQYLIIDEISYRFGDPDRGEVIVFKFPGNPTQAYIKRIIGLPGETVRITDGIVTISNTDNPDGFVLAEPYITHHTAGREPITITLPEDEYFVMGDNRAQSYDSRFWGPLGENFIIGRTLLRLWPPKVIGVFPGVYTDYTEQ